MKYVKHYTPFGKQLITTVLYYIIFNVMGTGGTAFPYTHVQLKNAGVSTPQPQLMTVAI